MSKVVESLVQKARDAAARQNLPEAVQCAAAAARLDGARADIQKLLGGLHFRMGAHAKASEAFRAALRLAPADPNIFHDLGVVLKLEGRAGEAEAMLREAWRRRPGFIGTVLSLCDLLGATGRRDEAETILKSVLDRTPDAFAALRDLTNMQIQAGRFAEAAAIVEQFIARNGQSVSALEQLSVVYQCLNRLEDALEITGATIAAQPPQTLDVRLASYLSISGRLARLDHRARAAALLPAAMETSLPEHAPETWPNNDLNALRRLAFLLPYYGVPDRALMRVFRAIGTALDARTPRPPSLKHQPAKCLRVGFVSYNFSEHPIGHLLSPFFEQHTTTGADLYLYALHLNAHDPSDYAGRIRATTGNYRDCRGMSAGALAAQIRKDNISILIDLDGYLGGGLPEALAMRPAPVQIHWLQHLAGMPAPFIDYTIVDRVLVGDDERDNGNGPLIRLPDAFQCGDRAPVPEAAPPRDDHGLPDDAFVFCAFGNWLKIDEDVFQCWLEILEGAPGSVLWLSDGPSAASRAWLQERLAERGLARERLIFAPRLPAKTEHLARHKCADLFLDTFAFSAATTTTDALWAGLPVLTRSGTTAQSRLSESLMRAVGFTETIVRDNRSYVATAIRIARRPTEAAMLKRKLARLLPESPLYDAGRMAAHFKTIYERVWERHLRGAPPAHMDIEAK